MGRLCERAKVFYSQAFTQYQDAVNHHEHEKTYLTEQFEKENTLLWGELWARDAEISELSRCTNEITFERDTLQGKVTLVERQLRDAKEDSDKYRGLHSELVAALSRIKAETEALVSSHGKEAIVANACVERASEGASPNLPRAVDRAWLVSQKQFVGGVLDGSLGGAKNEGRSPEREDVVEKGPSGDS
ncbi:uncharacterized protein [Nicotiana sylvestris]|uniref:Uncharacterized protein LOC104235809 n=1 Tax=Nicotiana sylvestris TaxID=4096 RepID=A0A1U7XLV5_NICSY|nr:PREDICTED: uncharacterized protein LOC104235809 [Nicotiana sylvestris]XP_009787935.1 PREDICTED: uncharacterized protein LOC104235809 [Nicotiana sylvestris]